MDGTYWIKDIPIPGATEQSLKTQQAIKREADNSRSIISELKQIHAKHTTAFKQQVLSQLKQIDPIIFEAFARKLLEVYGFKDMIVTRPIKDGGIDGNGKVKVGITDLHVAFQCKRWKGKVGRTEINKFQRAIQGEFE